MHAILAVVPNIEITRGKAYSQKSNYRGALRKDVALYIRAVLRRKNQHSVRIWRSADANPKIGAASAKRQIH